MKKKRWVLIAIIAVFVAVIIAVPYFKRYFVGKDIKEAPSQAVSTSPSQRSLNVNAEIIKYQAMTDKTVTTGNILPSEQVDLAFESSGKITDIFFNEGEFIKKGTLLAKINDKPLLAQLQKLETQLPLAQDRVYRQETLLAKNAVSQEAYEYVVTELEKLKADIELVKANIEQTALYAPFDGIIGLREVSEGAYVSPTTNIARLTNISTLKIDFAVPESYANEVKKGTKIKFKLEDNSGIIRDYDAEVYAVESKIDMATRTLQVRALYDNPAMKLIPGRYTSVEITRNEIPNALSVPSEAIIPEMGRNLVYLYKDGIAQPAEIVTGIRTESRVQALNGISVGDTLIISGVMQLRTGTKVIINNLF
ncbi:efflux RND transporter periplasmic adaptor subunit [Bacteroidales bacterium OttesenSCG-928-K03]|nr:efflux RND transporter periplasmic adaptor subunit [Odoribacter sp. OttesenSCG-928-L07]MDL2240921.1 efflux RND transporter periplasmic adaptor subunit [Bacteroidales bacterium OttesenSCG-928-K22]MDL2242516.1 efflux RND transporter periplasmic adaptor subunit [Bacteroidales bacterium OttesenSCG-928-K03]